MSEELVAFLRARLDEDQAAVEVVLGVNVVAALRQGKPAPRWIPSPEGDAGIWDTNGTPRVKFAWARERDHIIRHDPARVLDEVDAKRRILRAHEKWCEGRCEAKFPEGGFDAAHYWSIKSLAAAYSAHPDYEETWRP